VAKLLIVSRMSVGEHQMKC